MVAPAWSGKARRPGLGEVMSDLTFTNLQRTERNKFVLKEAYFLETQLAAMDAQIDAAVRKIHGDYAVDLERYLEESDGARLVLDKGVPYVFEKRLQATVAALAKLFKIGVKEIPGIGIVLDVFTSDKNPSYRAAYLDSPGDPRMLRYEEKRQRLQAIWREMSDEPGPPIQLNMRDMCEHEACWRSR
jgi:hypothetical protein